MATALFAEFYARGKLVVANDAAQTAQNILAHETLWRLGIANSLLCSLTDVALITALYVVLKPVGRNLGPVCGVRARDRDRHRRGEHAP